MQMEQGLKARKNETTAGAKSFLKELTAALMKIGVDGTDGRLSEIEARAGKDLDVEQLVALLNNRVEQRLSQISERATGFFRNATEDLQKSLVIRPESDVSKAVSYSTHVKDPHLGDQLPMVDILACGTGLQSMTILCLLQTFAEMGRHDDSIMLIEEPEVYLHPEFQRKMFSALRKIARGTQVIYTTHSPIMISDVWADESVRLVKRGENGESVFSQVDLQGVISELGIRYEDVLNPKIVVFVEGDTDACVLARIATALHPELATSVIPKIKFIPTDGFRQIQTFALMKILHSDSVTSKFFVVSDNDGYEAQERAGFLYNQIIQKVPEAAGKTPSLRDRILVLDVHEIESYFFTLELLGKIVPGIAQDDLRTFLNAYTEQYRQSREVYLKTKNAKDRQNLAHLFRPSLVLEGFKGAEHREAFKKAHSASDDFVNTVDQITAAFEKTKRSNQNPYLTMLDAVDVTTYAPLKELRDLVGSLLKNLDDK
ncbi:MAG: AAA family ATPase [Elusimicrobia bacterium]|nr:AAA family ATPase [Elusimicrobiota bacterium]